MTDWKAVGQRISDRREELKLTLEQLGAAVGSAGDAARPMRAGTVWQHEQGVRAMGEELVERFAKALDMTEWALRYGIVAMSDADREMIERDGFRRGYEAAREKVRRALNKIGFEPAANTPLGKFFAERKDTA